MLRHGLVEEPMHGGHDVAHSPVRRAARELVILGLGRRVEGDEEAVRKERRERPDSSVVGREGRVEMARVKRRPGKVGGMQQQQQPSRRDRLA